MVPILNRIKLFDFLVVVTCETLAVNCKRRCKSRFPEGLTAQIKFFCDHRLSERKRTSRAYAERTLRLSYWFPSHFIEGHQAKRYRCSRLTFHLNVKDATYFCSKFFYRYRVERTWTQRNLPWHVLPFPWYPGLHVQVNDPYVLLQNALRSHLAGVLIHSSISGNKSNYYYY